MDRLESQGVYGLSVFSLAIPRLWDEWAQLRAGGLYWQVCERAGEADALCRQVLAGMTASQRALLLTCGRGPQAILQGLPAELGPGELIPLEFSAAGAPAALRALARDLQRRFAPRQRLLLLSAPAAAWSAFDDAQLARWCRELSDWLQRQSCTLLIYSHGEPQAIAARLLACNDALSGLAQLYSGRGGLRYLLHFWRTALGVRAGGEVDMAREDGVLVCRPESEQGSPGAAASDLQLCLAARAVLEGAPPLSAHWQLFDAEAALLAAAMRATAASVILRIDSNEQVGELARQIYELRRQRGRALKVVVRELSACLRYLDEQLLLVCGASLIVPYGTALSRFLTLLDSLQGQLWTRSLPDDFEQTLKRLRPPPLRGLLPAPRFVEVVRGILDAGGGGEVSHLLLRLKVVDGLALPQVLGQCRLRRYGDMACVAGGELYLFLFACRANALESALGNIFRLSWRELFAAHEILVDTRSIPLDGASATSTPLPALRGEPAPAPAASGPVRLTPVRVRLSAGQSRVGRAT